MGIVFSLNGSTRLCEQPRKDSMEDNSESEDENRTSEES